MGLRLIYGKSGSGKSSYCFSEIAKLVNEKEKIYFITPEQFSFTAQKNLMEFLKEKAVINAEVLSFSRMAHRALDEIGGSAKTNLSKCGKAMMIYSILDNNKNNFNFLGKSDENIEIGIQTISELKKHGITLEKLDKEIENVKDIYLKTKLKDIKLIYKNFEEQIYEKYIEETDLLTIFAKNIKDIEFLKDSIIYIDEFSGFTSQEYDIISNLIKYVKQVNITICIDDLNYNTNPDTDIYYSNKQTLKKLVNIIDKNKLKMEEPIKLDKQIRLKNKELKHLSENIFNIKSTKYEQKVENIHIFLAKNQYSEIENVAKTIVKLVRDEKYRYKDIAIIAKNIDTYSSLIRSIFKDYEIPIFIDEKRDLNQNIIVQYVLSILDILSNNFASESIFNYIKFGFLEIEKDEIFKLENYCQKWEINRNKWKKDFIIAGENENKKQDIDRLNEIRKEIINPIIKLKNNIDKDKSAQNISKQLYDFLQENNIEQKIKQKVEKLNNEGLIDLANEYIVSYKIILEILDEIVLAFKQDKIPIEKYSKIIKVGLKNSGLGKIPGTQDQVIFGDVDRTKSHRVKAVFIIGMNDGIFPSVNKNEGFLNDEDREILKKDGLELAKGTIENLYEDNFNIYKVFNIAENKIYMSYSSSDNEGKTLRPSIFINKIKKIFPLLKEESDVISKKYEIINKKITYEELIQKISKLKENENIENIWYDIYNYYQKNNNWNKKLQYDLKGLKYTNLPSKIKKENIDKLYGNVLNTSVSRLEQYRKCPFSYYLQYGLKIKPKEQFKIQSFNTGSFMHETIDDFFQYVKDENLKLPEIEEQKIYKIVSMIIDENLNLSKNYIFTATAKYKMLVKRLKKLVSKALKYIIETLIYSDFNIEGTEIEFSESGNYKPIILELEDNKKIEITGKIDRIDTAENEDGKFLRIIDYKSSSRNIELNEVYAGLQIQLLTYMDAVCKEKDINPAGVFYFSLLEQIIPAEKRISDDEIEERIRKKFRMQGLIVADVKIIKMNDNTLNSGSSIYVPAGLTTQGAVRKDRTNGVEKEEFKILQQYIYKTIKNISKEILSGKIDLQPFNKNGNTPCDYCEYKPICNFDVRQKGNKYNYIDKKTKDDVILKMKQELEKEG